MKVVILAGGLGTRLAEETEARPKPMVEIGGRPILWHIMKHYAAHGFNEFVIAARLQGRRDQALLPRLRGAAREPHDRPRHAAMSSHEGSAVEDWAVHLVDTGLETSTGGRVRAAATAGSTGETFMADLRRRRLATSTCGALLRFHRAHGRLATVTAVRPPARFGGLVFDGDRVAEFTEKPQIGEGWINGGFLVFEPALFDYLDGDDDEPRGRRARAARGGRPARGLPPRRLLAVHGHAARQAAARVALGDGRGAVEACGMSAAFWRDRPTLVTGATGLVGGWLVRRLVERGRRRRLPRARLGAADRELVRGGLLERVTVVRGDVRDQALLERVARRVRDRHGLAPRGADDRRRSRTATRSRRSRRTSPAPGRCSRRAGAARRSSRSSSPRPTRPTAISDELPYAEDDAARRAGTPTTSASRAPT